MGKFWGEKRSCRQARFFSQEGTIMIKQKDHGNKIPRLSKALKDNGEKSWGGNSGFQDTKSPTKTRSLPPHAPKNQRTRGKTTSGGGVWLNTQWVWALSYRLCLPQGPWGAISSCFLEGERGLNPASGGEGPHIQPQPEVHIPVRDAWQ